MNGLIRLRCEGCGASLVRDGADYICDHCGARYTVECGQLFIVEAKARVKRLCVSVPARQEIMKYLDPDAAKKYLRDRMLWPMMDLLQDEMQIEEWESPDGPVYRGSLWVRAKEDNG